MKNLLKLYVLFITINIYSQTHQWAFFTTDNSPIPSNFISKIHQDKDGVYWFGAYPYGASGSGLARFDGVNWEIFNTANSGLPDNIIFDITSDNANNLWVATPKGAVKYNGTEWTLFNASNSGLPDDNVYTITVEDDNYIWFGMNYHGLVKYDGTNWEIFDTNNSLLHSNEISFIVIDDQNGKWIGTWRGGLCFYDDNTWQQVSHQNFLNYPSEVYSLAIDYNNALWVTATGTGSNNVHLGKYLDNHWILFDSVTAGFKFVPGFGGITIDSLNRKWFATTSGIAIYNDSEWSFITPENSPLPSKYIHTMIIDNYQNIWFGLGQTPPKGIAVYNENGIPNITSVNDETLKPVSFKLYQNYPNPFNPTTKIKYSVMQTNSPLLEGGRGVLTTLKIYDILGNEISTLVNELKPPGTYEVDFDASKLSSGVYIYRLISGDFSSGRKMILLR